MNDLIRKSGVSIDTVFMDLRDNGCFPAMR